MIRRIGEAAGPSRGVVPREARPMPRPEAPPREKPAQRSPGGAGPTLGEAFQMSCEKIMRPFKETYDNAVSPFKKLATAVAALLILLLVVHIVLQVFQALTAFNAFLAASEDSPWMRYAAYAFLGLCVSAVAAFLVMTIRKLRR